MRHVWAWFRLMFTLVVFLCSAFITRSGCGVHSDNPAVVPMPMVHVRPRAQWWWTRRHLAKLDEARDLRQHGGVDLLFVGDSITQNYERNGPEPYFLYKPVWDQYFAPHRAFNLGFNGDRTENVLFRLQHGEADGLHPKDVVLMIGFNNLNPTVESPNGHTAEQTIAGTIAVIQQIHATMPEARLLVLGILPTNISAERMQRIASVNAGVRAYVAGTAYARWRDVGGFLMDGPRVRAELYYDPIVWPGSPAIHPRPEAQRIIAQQVADALYGSPAAARAPHDSNSPVGVEGGFPVDPGSSR